MNVFYSTDPGPDFVVLDEVESGHAIRVLRMTAGEEVVVLDGKGHIHTAVIEEPHPKRCKLKITGSRFDPMQGIQLHIGIAPVKMNDRMEWFLEKATELGITSITPLLCSRSERKNINEERFKKVIVSALKQSMNPWLPDLEPMVTFQDYIRRHPGGYIAHCMEHPVRTGIGKLRPQQGIIRVLIGPEGDFTTQELDLAVEAGYAGLSLGASRLRTETAGLMVCAGVRLLNEAKPGTSNP